MTSDNVKPATVSVFGRIQAPRDVFETQDLVNSRDLTKTLSSANPHNQRA